MTRQSRIALVTGGSQGIGRACALELASMGHDVVLTFLGNRENADEVAAEIQRIGSRSLVFHGDAADRSRAEGIVDEIVAEWGRIDVLVANAAASVRKPFLQLTVEDMEFTLGPTLMGVFHYGQLVARDMVRRQEGGSIVVVSSVHAWMPYKNCLPYNAAKAGVNHMARTMANELTKYGIRVNVVEPGWTDTPGERASATDEQIIEAAKALPLGRLATSAEIAKGVAFLASEDASYITGSTLRIDGGFVFPRPEY